MSKVNLIFRVLLIVSIIQILGCKQTKTEFDPLCDKFNILNVRNIKSKFRSSNLYYMDNLRNFGSFNFSNYLLFKDNKMKIFSVSASCNDYYKTNLEYRIAEQMPNDCLSYIKGDSSGTLNECDIHIKTFFDFEQRKNDTIKYRRTTWTLLKHKVWDQYLGDSLYFLHTMTYGQFVTGIVFCKKYAFLSIFNMRNINGKVEIFDLIVNDNLRRLMMDYFRDIYGDRITLYNDKYPLNKETLDKTHVNLKNIKFID